MSVTHAPARSRRQTDPWGSGEWLPAMRLGGAPPVRAARAVAAALLVSGLLAVVAGGVALWEAQRMASAHAGRIAPGVVVDGLGVDGMAVDGMALSGLSPEAAAAQVQAEAATVLDRPVSLVGPGATVEVTPRAVGVDVDVDAVLAEAVAVGEGSSLWDWVRIRWRGAVPVTVLQVGVTEPDPTLVDALLGDLASRIDRPVVDAAMDYDTDAVTFHPAQDGRRLDVATARAAILAALDVGAAGASDARGVARGDGVPRPAGPAGDTVVLPVDTTPATTTLADLGQVLYLDQSEHRLQLWDAGVLRGEWVVATGRRGYGTPTGEYWVEEKRENPTWGNPAPDGWGAGMPAWIGPGPGNPLGVRAINWGGTDHIRFHGTSDEGSLGTQASHGCVRLSNDDVVELFDLVQLGARIISVD